jgi:hypothetical protein
MNIMMMNMKTTNMKYLKRFNENKSMDFYLSNYEESDKSIVGAYMIIEESEKTITILNIQEKEDKRGIFADGKIPYTFIPFKVRLPKSQIEVLEPVESMEGFKWIKIPYWLVKNNPGLKIERLKKSKRFSNNSTLHKLLKPEMIDDDVRKYLNITDKDPKTIFNLNLLNRKKFEGWDSGRTIFSRDNKIADEIISKFNEIKNLRVIEDRSIGGGKKFQFELKSYTFEIHYDVDLFDYIHPSGYYEIKMEGRVLDISWIKSRKIYKQIEKMWKDQDDDDQYFQDKKRDFIQ